MRDKVYRWLSLIVLLLSQLSGLLSLSVAAEEKEYSYEAYVKSGEYQDFDNPIYVRKIGTQEEFVAYCFNYHAAWPTNFGSQKYPKYKEVLGEPELFKKLADSATLGAQDLEKAVLKVIYNGYGNDASRLQEKYNLSNGVFRRITQYAIWYFTDSKDFPTLDDSKLSSFKENEKQALKDLVGKGEILEEIPANTTLKMYLTNGEKPLEKSSYQNLLGANFFRKGTEEEIHVKKRKFSIYAQKVWENVELEDVKPEVSFQLKKRKSGKPVGKAKLIKTPKGQNEFSVQWDDLEGELSDYTIEEVEQLSDYLVSPVQGNGTQESPFKIINRKKSLHLEFVQSIQVNKKWQGDGVPSDRPEIYFALYKRINGVESLVTESDLESVKNNPQKWQGNAIIWKNIYAPGRDKNSNAPIEYFVKEVKADGSDWSAPNYLKPEVTSSLSGANSLVFNFTNTYKKEKTKVDIFFSKQNIIGEELEKAEIEIFKATANGQKGERVTKWNSTKEAHKFTLEEGDYIFVENAAPAGYEKVSEVHFTVTTEGRVKVSRVGDSKEEEVIAQTAKVDEKNANKLIIIDQAIKHSVEISKVGLGGKALAGAVIEIRDENGKTIMDAHTGEALRYTSTNQAKKVSLTSGTYVFHEVTAPTGYQVVTDITFTVGENGTIKVMNNTTTGNAEVKDGKLVVTDAVECYPIVFSKVASLGGEELPDARIVIFKEDGRTEIERFTSTIKAKELNLPMGTYIFHEEVAPKGYNVVTDITFTVDAKGKVTAKNVNGNTVEAKDNQLQVVDTAKVVEIKKHDIEISKQNLGGEELENAEIEIFQATADDQKGAHVTKWTSTKSAHKLTLEAGHYIFVENAAPAGYEKVSEIHFTVSTDGKVKVTKVGSVTDQAIMSNTAKVETLNENKLVVIDQAKQYDIEISKQNIAGDILEKATVTVRNKKTNKVVSDVNGVKLENYVTTKDNMKVKLEAGEYTFEENAAPAGYDVVTTFTFTVTKDGKVTTTSTEAKTEGSVLTVIDQATKHKIEVSKVGLGGKELPGAQIQIKQGDTIIHKWTSTDKTKVVQLAAGRYTFHEVAAPTGYKVVTDISFTVDESGKVTVTEDTKTAHPSKTKGNHLTVVDEAIAHDVLISKVDIAGQEVAGASITIYNELGNIADNRINGHAPAEWTSKEGEAFQLKLLPGIYTFKEKVAPKGLQKVTELKFKVDEQGNVSIVSPGVNDDQTEATALVADGNRLVVTDKPETPEVVFSKVNLGGKEIAGAHIEIHQADRIVAKWVSEADKSHTIKLAGGEYVFHEKVAPSGYEVVTDIIFVVNQDGKVTVKEAGDNIVSASGNKLTVTDKDAKAPETTTESTTESTTVIQVTEATTESTTEATTEATEKEVVFSKVNLGGKEIAGAHIEIHQADRIVAKWVSEADKSHTIKLAGGEYVFHEKVAPSGYEVVTDIIFVVNQDGKVTVKEAGDNIVSASGNKLTVTDKDAKAPETTTESTTESTTVIQVTEATTESTTEATTEATEKEVVFSKVNLGGKEIAGAHIEIHQADRIVAKWVSEADKSHTIKLAGGEYVFHEKVAPSGYEVVTDIIFVVNQDGKVTVKEAGDNIVSASGNKLTVTDKDAKAPETTTESTTEATTVTQVTEATTESTTESTTEATTEDAEKEVVFSKVNLGGKEIAGAYIEIHQADRIVAKWVSEADKSHTIKLAGGEYVFHEKVAPSGYEVVTDIIFVVSQDGRVTVKEAGDNIVSASGNKLTVTDKDAKAPETTTESTTESTTVTQVTEATTESTTEATTVTEVTEAPMESTTELMTENQVTESTTEGTTEATTVTEVTEVPMESTTELTTVTQVTEATTDSTTESTTVTQVTEATTESTTELTTESQVTEATTESTTELTTEITTESTTVMATSDNSRQSGTSRQTKANGNKLPSTGEQLTVAMSALGVLIWIVTFACYFKWKS